MVPNDYDVFSYRQEQDGYIITKNGDFFLLCTGGEAEAKRIAEILNKDEKRTRRESDGNKV